LQPCDHVAVDDAQAGDMKQIACWKKVQIVAVVVGPCSSKCYAGIEIIIRQHARKSDNRPDWVILRSWHPGQRFFVQRKAEWRISGDAFTQHRDLVDDLVVRGAILFLCRKHRGRQACHDHQR
jgi:hypothetical protein